ncbi:MAG: response regulator [bacterium]
MGDEGRILIVDDDSKTRSAYKELFIGHGFDTAVAEGETQALELLRSESFQAVLLDLRVSNSMLLPIAERIKKEFPRVFISLMLIDSTPALIKKAIDVGIDDYLIKPLLPMRLIDGVRKGILRHSLEAENERLKHKLEEVLTQNHKWIMHDLETGVFNSQYFFERLDMEVKRAQRHEHWLSLLLCHLDCGTREIEEEAGITPPSAHEILEVLKVLSGNIRNVDIIARYNSGFAVILPETTMEGSATLCSRLKKNLVSAFENNENGLHSDLKGELNIRFGAATYPLDSHLPRRLIKIAEDRLQ